MRLSGASIRRPLDFTPVVPVHNEEVPHLQSRRVAANRQRYLSVSCKHCLVTALAMHDGQRIGGNIRDMRRGPGAGAVPHAGPVGWTIVRHPVSVAGQTMPGEMLYVGRGLVAASGGFPEPSLIDPSLPVDWRLPDWHGETVPYWPSYAALRPGARAAYLRWLATGRRHPDVPIGYVFLFFYGLERRVLLELPHLPDAQQVELPAIRAEVDELLRIYGGNRSFSDYARGFCDVLDMIGLLRTDICAGPPPAADRPSPPASLRLGLSGFATSGRPVPAEWALAWLRSCAGFRSSASVRRCEPEFGRLFHKRYMKRYGAGLVLRPEGREISLDYRPASAGFRGWRPLVLHGRPEAIGQEPAVRELVGLAEECAQALEAYARYLAREPDGRGSIGAAGLLPVELLDAGSGNAGAVMAWARGRLDGSASITVSAEELLDFLPSSQAPRKKDVVAVAQLLAAIQIGMEPDPRLGGPVVTSGPIVLFKEEEPCSAPSSAYQAATLLLHLGVVVGVADGHVTDQEKETLLGHLERGLQLSAAEQDRLRAHLRWLLIRGPKLTGLTRRISTLEMAQREDIAAFLTTVAAADGVIDPAEITTLKRIRKLLDLDPEAVEASLQDASGAPVTVRRSEPSAGYSIPAPTGAPQARARVQLDDAALAAKLAESAEIAALLESVFAEDEPQPTTAPTSTPEVALVADLDAAHSELLRSLAGRESISRSEWERLAADARLMPDGALDRINESAFEAIGEPVAEGDDPIEINQYAMGELL